VYEELRRLAAHYMGRERRDHTLQPTALVNELYLRMVDGERVDWLGKAQFFALAARQIRRILIEHARKHLAAKRGGGANKLTLDEAGVIAPGASVDLLALDEAMSKLAERSERQAQVVELRFFGGMSVEDAAGVLGVSATTVKDDWTVARAWLRRELSKGEA
jgi:RNA polymerase sigma factor (TIGR02999 family)